MPATVTDAPPVAGPRRTAWSVLGVVAVVLVVAGGIVARFVTRSSLWLDEALTANIAGLALGDIGDALRRDGHPPLFYWLLHSWMRVFGEGDVAVRSLSGVASVAALPLAWVAGRRAAGRPGAVAALVLLASSPFAVRYATEARMYSLAMLLVLVGLLLVPDAVQAPSWPRLAGVALLTAALLYTHYWAIYLTAATAAVLVLLAWRWPERRVGAGRTLAAVVVGGLAFLPWVPTLLHQAAHTGTPWSPPARPTVVVAQTVSDLGGFASDSVTYGVALVVLTLLGLLAVGAGRTRLVVDLRTVGPLQPQAAVAGATVLLGVTVAFVTSSAYASRYFAVVFPIVLLLTATGVTRFDGAAVRAGALALMVVVAIPGIGYSVRDNRTQASMIAEALQRDARPGDVVVVCPDQLGPAVTRDLPEGVTSLAFPEGDGRFVDWTDYAERNRGADPAAFAQSALAATPVGAAVWVVSSGSYRTFEGKCEALLAQLAGGRGPAQVVVAEDGGRFFEHATLVRLPSP